MDLYRSVLRPLLFKMDPEKVHELALKFAAKGLIKEHRTVEYTPLEQNILGGNFKNPLGLAAGFDKNATALSHWNALGFGFVEIGTVTFYPQEGNPKPRLFRLEDDQALINRLGFNNLGAHKVTENIMASRCEIPFGVNIGKSFITPIEKAAEDYKKSLEILRATGCAYFAINVSSPNTPNLRSLQEKDKLKDLLTAIREMLPVFPILVKVSPDLELTAIDDIIQVAKDTKMTGFIATNTTISRDGLSMPTNEGGGLSGRPLRARSNLVLSHLAKNGEKRFTLIGVGGIFTGEDLYQKIALGAHLCQVYTGWVYSGPDMVPTVLDQMSQLMEAQGLKHVDELRGVGLK